MTEQKIKLRPVSEFPDPDRVHYQVYASLGVMMVSFSRLWSQSPGWIEGAFRWFYADDIPRPDEPNPVYAGDRVEFGNASVVVVGPSALFDSFVVIGDLGDQSPRYFAVRADALTYNNRPVTHFEYGKRPEVER